MATDTPPPMVVRLDFAEYKDADGYTHISSWTFDPPMGMTRDDIEALLLDKGFKRIDNMQDHEDAFGKA